MPGSSRPTRCLVVDDERMNREVVVANLRAAGYETLSAEDGQQAWRILDTAPEQFDVILLDRRMPRMDGMELLALVKADKRLAHIPVIMQTAHASSEDVVAGIKAGVYYYLAKPLDRRLLLSVTSAAIEEYRRFVRLRDDLAKRTTAMALMDRGSFRFRTLAEAETLAVALAQVCPRSQHLVVGLSEIFTNAVEHGNLGITFEEKARLLAEKRWRQQIEALLDTPQNRAKFVTVSFQRLPGEVRITVKDEGLGFDWRRYMELDPKRAFAVHGRGIAMARKLAFDSVEFQDPGNEVTCIVRGGDADSGQAPTSAAPQAPTATAPITTAPNQAMTPPTAEPPPAPPPDQATAAPAPTVSAEEMRLARRMQEELLPSPTQLETVHERLGLSVSGFFETSSELGGDLWGMEAIDDTRLILWLADFSGHGVSAALNTFRMHTLVEHAATDRENPAQFLGVVNTRLAGLLPRGQYATMLYGIADLTAGTFRYAAAAAPRPVVAAQDGTVQEGDGSGLPLGVSRLAKYTERKLDLPPGGVLFMASDALSELPAEDGSKLGLAGVSALIREVVAARGTQVDANSILAPFLATARRPLADDLTAVCCVRPA